MNIQGEKCLLKSLSPTLLPHTWHQEQLRPKNKHRTHNCRAATNRITTPPFLSYIKSSSRYVLLWGIPYTEYFTLNLITVDVSMIRTFKQHGTPIAGWGILLEMLYWVPCKSLWMHGLSSLESPGISFVYDRMILTKNMRFPLAAGLIFLFRSLFLVIFLSIQNI